MVTEHAAGRGAVLVTGGAGYIGAQTAKVLASKGWLPIVFDNLSSGHREAVQWGEFVHGDVRDGTALRDAIEGHGVTSVIHFAGLIEVGASVVRPDLFYEHNVAAVATLLRITRECSVDRIVFSSSAAVYGAGGGASGQPLREDGEKAPASPYGDTKLAAERMIAAHCAAFGHTAIALRYFNAAGADPEGLIGEAHYPETHLIPLAIAAGLGGGKPLTVFGRDFDTPDGACLRDFVHVCDLAEAHVAALQLPMQTGRFEAMNLGTGRGHSVLEVIAAVEQVIGNPVMHVVGPRRTGDPAVLVADPSRARARLGWTARCSSLNEIVADAVRWRRSPRYGPATAEPGRPSAAEHKV